MKNFIVFLFLACTVLACKQDKVSSLPNYSGLPGKVAVVTTKAQWEGLIGDSIQTVLRKAQYGLPQPEPIFDLINISKSSFENVFKTFRNVLIIEIDKNRMSKGEVRFHKNAYAKEQFLITIMGDSRAEILDLISKNKSKIVNYFNNTELNRLVTKNKSSSNDDIVNLLRDKFGIAMHMNKDAYIANVDSNDVWFRTEKSRKKGGFEHQISQGMLIYQYPYTDTHQLSDAHLLKKRDQFLKKNIPGSKEGSYVTTEYKYIPPRINDLNFRNSYAKEIRGLWEMKNGFMGGPMYSVIVLDEKKGRIIGMTGYVYAPEFDKRELIREMEAEIKSMDWYKETPQTSKSEASQ